MAGFHLTRAQGKLECTATLLGLLGNESIPVWTDGEGRPCTLPWEALALSLLLYTYPETGRDVALTIFFGQSLVMSKSLRIEDPVVEPRRIRNDRCQRQWPWEYAPRNTRRRSPTTSSTPQPILCQVLFHPMPSAAETYARIDVLPPKLKLIVEAESVARGSAEGDHFDIFCIAAQVCTGPLRNALGMLAAMANAEKSASYFSKFPLSSPVSGQDKQCVLIILQNQPEQFAEACQLYSSDGTDIHELLWNSPRSRSESPLVAAMSNVKTLSKALKWYRPKEDPDYDDVLCFAIQESSDATIVVLRTFLNAGEGFVASVAGVEGALLRILDQHPEALHQRTMSNDDVFRERLRFLVSDCAALGFNLVTALKARAVGQEVGRYKYLDCSVPTLRGIFSEYLGLQRTLELLSPIHLLQFFRTPEAMQYALEELGYPLSYDSAPKDCEALLGATLQREETLPVTLYLLKKLHPELNSETVEEYLDVLCVRLRRSLSCCPSVLSLVRYFIERGWLTKDFRFKNGDRLQHRMPLGVASTKSGSSSPMVDFLRLEMGLDLAEVSPSGEFPFALALQRRAWPDALCLATEALLPRREVLRGYRYKANDTLLSLLLRLRGSHPLLGEKTSQQPGLHHTEFIQICEKIGLDVIREMSKIHCTDEYLREMNALPLGLAFCRWPLPVVKYLVEEVKIYGCSDLGFLRHLLTSAWASRCMDEKVIKYLNRLERARAGPSQSR
jgi:hypothetical protein